MTKYQFPWELTKLEELVSSFERVEVEDIRGHDRRQEMVRARHGVWCLAVRFMGFRMIDIARLYNRDHTTIMHALQKYRNTNYERFLRQDIEAVWPEAFSDEIRKKSRHYGNLHYGWRAKQTA